MADLDALRRRGRTFADVMGHWLARPRYGAHALAAGAPRHVRTYSCPLPAGYPARTATVRLSVPALPHPALAFSEHVTSEAGQPTDTVLATTLGGFAISRDLGRTWARIGVKGFRNHRFVHARALRDGRFLVQAAPLHWGRSDTASVDLLTVGENGAVHAVHRAVGCAWHSCRAVDEAHGTIMYAEYPANRGRRTPSRVLRSRDNGETWQTVFERSGADIRHFHFLQARPHARGEWCLTSGDHPEESRIWVSKDDGDTWRDVTEAMPPWIAVGGARFRRDLFRLTDLDWHDGEVIWGTDDYLGSVRGAQPGARIFASPIADTLAPREIARAKWHLRSMVDVGAYYIVISQGSDKPGIAPSEERPGVFLMPKSPPAGAPPLVHLFDIDVYSPARTAFTYSRASRAASDGTFFTYRSSTDGFPSGHNLLVWNVAFS